MLHVLSAGFPTEMQIPGELWSAYEQVLGQGLTRIRRAQLTVLGARDTGKTWLVHHLQCERFDPDMAESTPLTVCHDWLASSDGRIRKCLISPVSWFAWDIVHRSRQISQKDTEITNAGMTKEDPDVVNILPKVSSSNTPQSSPHCSLKLRPDAKTPPSSLAQRLTAPACSSRTQCCQEHDVNFSMRQLLGQLASNPDLSKDHVEEEIAVSVFDTSPDLSHSRIQHLVVGKDFTVNLLCFNASEDLGFASGGARAANGGQSHQASVASQIRRSLLTLQLGGRSQQRGSDYDDHPLFSPVILVGTHADRISHRSTVSVNERRSQLWKELEMSLSDCPLFQAMTECPFSTNNVSSLHLIANTDDVGSPSSLSPEMEKLSQHVANAILYVTRSPTSVMRRKWVRFEWVLQHLRSIQHTTLNGNGFTTRRHVHALFQEMCQLISDAELEEMLIFYNSLRLIAYRPQRTRLIPGGSHLCGVSRQDEIVVFDMPWLVQEILAVVGSSRLSRLASCEALEEWHSLKTSGRLGHSLLMALWGEDEAKASALAQFLSQLDLLYINEIPAVDVNGEVDIGHRREVLYFVPAAIDAMASATPQDLMHRYSNSQDTGLFSTAAAPLLVAVKSHHGGNNPDIPIPHALFCCVVTQLMKIWRVASSQRSDYVQLTRDTACLPVCIAGLAPKWAAKLDIRAFLAFLEPSGSILLSLAFAMINGTGAETLDIPLAEVCSKLREQVLLAISDICQGAARCPDQLSQYVVAMPPPCHCSLSSVTDIGQAPWKMHCRGTGEAGRASMSFYHSGDSCLGCGAAHGPTPPTAYCWFNISQ